MRPRLDGLRSSGVDLYGQPERKLLTYFGVDASSVY